MNLGVRCASSEPRSGKVGDTIGVKAALLVLLVLGVFPLRCASQDPSGGPAPNPGVAQGDPFALGVKRYQEGKYGEAEAAFRQVDPASSTVLYNLGNACFKQGKLGQAILSWEKTMRLDPLNRDCAGNLELASMLLRDALPPDETPLPLQWIRSALFALPVEYLERGTLVFWVLANLGFLLLVVLRRAPQGLKVFFVATLLCCLLTAGLYVLNLHRQRSHNYGIVVVPKESVRSGPGLQNTVLMEIHEGLKVKILNTQGGWVAVKIAGGYSGWLPIESIGVL